MGDVLQRLSIIAHGHVDLVLARPSNSVELFEQELDQLGLLLLGDCRKAVNDDKVIITLVERDFILLAKVGEVKVIFIEFLVVEVGLAELFETSGRRGRHAGQWVYVAGGVVDVLGSVCLGSLGWVSRVCAPPTHSSLEFGSVG